MILTFPTHHSYINKGSSAANSSTALNNSKTKFINTARYAAPEQS
jgi:hypothetical protein